MVVWTLVLLANVITSGWMLAYVLETGLKHLQMEFMLEVKEVDESLLTFNISGV